jgi:FkbM family methyltransferase
MGVYDLVVSETIWRLLDPGETAVDAGAHIGYMTALMAAKAGPTGTVFCFEPHPDNFLDLSNNIAGWLGNITAKVIPMPVALSSRRGSGQLEAPPAFATNRGISRLSAEGATGNSSGTSVTVDRLDHVLPDSPQVGVLKIDVEGHEVEVLHGAEGLLQKRKVRDIVFEELSGSFKSPVAELLTSRGFAVIRLARSFAGPLLLHSDEAGFVAPYLPPSFLATLEPERARSRLSPRGWNVLRRRQL